MSRALVTTRVCAGVLRWARETAGLEIAGVAARLGVAAETVAKWESGEKEVAFGRLEALARLYRRPVAALLLPAPPPVPSLPHDFRTLPSERSAFLSTETLLAIRDARRIQSVTKELASELGVAAADVPPRGALNPLELAARERRHLGITVPERRARRKSGVALRRWRDALEGLNVLVVQLPFAMEDARGFSLPDEVAPVIAINSRDAENGRIFTLFHEYAHLLLGSSALCIPEIGSEAPTQQGSDEAYCNAFAGAFLVPDDALREVMGGRSLDDTTLEELAAEFSVSRHVILHRLRATGLLSAAHLRRKLEQLLELEARLIRPRKAFARSPAHRCIGARGNRFVRLVLEAKAHDLITYRDVADYLALRVRHFDAVEAMVGEGDVSARK